MQHTKGKFAVGAYCCFPPPSFSHAIYYRRPSFIFFPTPNTGDYSKQDPRYTQKTINLPLFTDNIWSYLLCPPVNTRNSNPGALEEHGYSGPVLLMLPALYIYTRAAKFCSRFQHDVSYGMCITTHGARPNLHRRFLRTLYMYTCPVYIPHIEHGWPSVVCHSHARIPPLAHHRLHDTVPTTNHTGHLPCT